MSEMGRHCWKTILRGLRAILIHGRRPRAFDSRIRPSDSIVAFRRGAPKTFSTVSVKCSKVQTEQMFSGLCLKADDGLIWSGLRCSGPLERDEFPYFSVCDLSCARWRKNH